MTVSLEKYQTTLDKERHFESLASPEVEADVDKIVAIEQDIYATLDLPPGSTESVEATDAFLVDNAERPDASAEDLKTALIAGALEVTGQRSMGDMNPITILELDGYGAEITDVVNEFHKSHATLPAGEQAAEVLAREIDSLASRHDLKGSVDLELSPEGTGIGQFDDLDDYSKEFPEQILMHRSNAELRAGDIVLPSDQISAEMHEQLNSSRYFLSVSSPNSGGIEYDQKLAHASTRDFGEVYGEHLYVVEPLEGDTLKWGENFGAGVQRSRRAESTAFEYGSNKLATTDSHTGKWLNEVVSTKGFRVVREITHEPSYRESMLPWPVSQEAVVKRKERGENKLSNVAAYGTGTSPGSGRAFPIRTTSRKRPGKIGPRNNPGTYRAGALELNPSELRTKYDVMKQHSENPQQPALPGMPVSKYGAPDRWNTVSPLSLDSPNQQQGDTPLPGMEGHDTPLRPLS